MSAIKPRLEPAYPPVDIPRELTWDALERLGRTDPRVRMAALLAERGDLTREQALVWIAYALYNQKAQLFATLLDVQATALPSVIRRLADWEPT